MADEKKIIIDEDWKSQVQAEKAAAARHKDEPDSGTVAAAGAQSASKSVSDDPAMPPASFAMLVTTLATEALVALGQIPHPLTGKAELQRNNAQYLIDTLDVLKQKTKGNLTRDELELVDSILHQVRMVFIAATNQPAKE